jgi:hypothetical protein
LVAAGYIMNHPRCKQIQIRRCMPNPDMVFSSKQIIYKLG